MTTYNKNIPATGVRFKKLKEMIDSRISGLSGISVSNDGMKVDIAFGRDLNASEQTDLDNILSSHAEPGRDRDPLISTVAQLPTNAREGETAFATDGRKKGQSPGNGTGVPCYFSEGSWRVYSDDSVVQA